LHAVTEKRRDGFDSPDAPRGEMKQSGLVAGRPRKTTANAGFG
jgi:hypothetical protein